MAELLQQRALIAESAPRSDARQTRRFKISPLASYSSLAQLLTQRLGSTVVAPKRYFRASNELVAVTLVLCWIITLLYDPSLALNHPARDFTGHINLCFGWDYEPASYVAIFMCAFDVYLAWTYATLEATRTRLRDYDNRTTWAEQFSLITCYLHGTASVIWVMLWSFGPLDGFWATHLAIFSTAIFFRYLCALGNYVEARFGTAFERGHVRTEHTYFIITYGVVTTLLPILYFYDIAVYRLEGRTGRDPPLPWWLLQILDALWMICLTLSSRLAVPEPPLKITYQVLELDDHIEVDDGEAPDWTNEGSTSTEESHAPRAVH